MELKPCPQCAELKRINSNANKIFAADIDGLAKIIEKKKALLIEVLEAIRYLLSFVPEWAKESEPGMDPTMYGTLTYEGDLEVIEEVKKIRVFEKADKEGE